MSSRDFEPAAKPRALGEDLLQGIVDAARANPLSAAAIGMGIAWLFVGGSKITFATAALAQGASAGLGGVRDGAVGATTLLGQAGSAGLSAVGAAAGQVRSGANAAGDLLQQAGHSAGQAVSDFAGRAVDAMSSGQGRVASASGAAVEAALDSADRSSSALAAWGTAAQAQGSRVAGSTVETLTGLFDRQPLLIGAVGLALGAGLAAALPQLDVENEWLGETSDALKAQANDLVSKGVSQAQAVKETVLKEAETQGLTVEALSDTVKTTAQKATDVANVARETLTHPRS